MWGIIWEEGGIECFGFDWVISWCFGFVCFDVLGFVVVKVVEVGFGICLLDECGLCFGVGYGDVVCGVILVDVDFVNDVVNIVVIFKCGI